MQADFPHYYPYFSRERFTYRGTTYRNHNKLLGTYDGVDGIKTGYIRASGYNLVASAARHGRRLVAVVMGGRSSKRRNDHMADLLTRGFKIVTAQGIGELVAPPDRKPWGSAPAAAAPQPELLLPPRRPGDATITSQVPAATITRTSSQATAILPGSGTSGVASGVTSGVTQTVSHLASPASWGVQVGAFRDFAPAEIAARQAARSAGHLLDESLVRVDTVSDSGGASVFRARLMGVDENEARAACRKLAAQHTACLVIPPEVSG